MKSLKLIGILFLSLSLGFSSCKKKKDDEVVEDPANLPLSIDAQLQTSFTFDGTVLSFTSANPDFNGSNGAGGSVGRAAQLHEIMSVTHFEDLSHAIWMHEFSSDFNALCLQAVQVVFLHCCFHLCVNTMRAVQRKVQNIRKWRI